MNNSNLLGGSPTELSDNFLVDTPADRSNISNIGTRKQAAREHVYSLIVVKGNLVDDSGQNNERADSIRDVIAAVGSQTRLPQALVVVNVDGVESDNSLIREYLDLYCPIDSWIVAIPKAVNFGEAIRLALTSDSFASVPNWYWFLHEDSRPSTDALMELLLQGNRGGTIALVGSKQVSWNDSDELLEVGIEATRSGRRAELSSHGEIDQGQYDDRQDVLAVGTAGMLVSGDVWQQTRGLDPHLGPFGDGLEYGRRLRRGGYRVVVAPKAIIAHKQKSLSSDKEWSPSFRKRREAQLYNWVLAVSPLVCIGIILGLAIWTPLRALGRLLTRRPRLAAAELGAYLDLLIALPAIARGRRRQRRMAKIPRSALADLELSSAQLWSRQRAQKRALKSRPKDRDQVDHVTIGAWRRFHRLSAGTLVSILVFMLLVSLYFWYPYLGGVAGGAWANLPNEWGQLWTQAWATWVVAGDGSPGPVNPLLPLFAVITLPFSWIGITGSQVGLGILVLALPLCALGGWAVGSLFTRSVPIRIAASFLWATQPTFLLAVTQGNLATVVSVLAIPIVFIALWRISGISVPWHLEGVRDVMIINRADPITWAGIGSIGLLIAASGAPGLVAIALFFGYLTVAVSNGDSFRDALLQRGNHGDDSDKYLTPSGKQALPLLSSATLSQKLIAVTVIWIPAFVLTLPTWAKALQTIGTPSTFIAVLFDPVSSTGISYDDSLLGLTGSFLQGTPVFSFFSLSGLIGLFWAIGTLIRSVWGKRSDLDNLRLTSILFLSGVVFTAVAAFSVGFVQPGILFVLAGFAWILTGLSPRYPYVVSQDQDRLSRADRGRRIGALLAVTASLVTGIGILFVPSDTSSNESNVEAASETGIYASSWPSIPLVAGEAQLGSRAARLLTISQTKTGRIVADLWRGDGLQQVDLSWGLRNNSSEIYSTAQQSLAQAVGTLSARPSSVVASQLGAHAIELVLLPTDMDQGVGSLYANLDASDGFERIGTTEFGTMWRVRPDVVPSRVTMVNAGNTEVIESGAVTVNTDVKVEVASTLILAEVADNGWSATFDGQKLDSVKDPDSQQGWRQAFSVPAGQGKLEVTYSPGWRIWWLLGTMATVAVALVCALPWRPKRSVWVLLPDSISNDLVKITKQTIDTKSIEELETNKNTEEGAL